MHNFESAVNMKMYIVYVIQKIFDVFFTVVYVDHSSYVQSFSFE